jgi:hypothetical protein
MFPKYSELGSEALASNTAREIVRFNFLRGISTSKKVTILLYHSLFKQLRWVQLTSIQFYTMSRF